MVPRRVARISEHYEAYHSPPRYQPLTICKNSFQSAKNIQEKSNKDQQKNSFHSRRDYLGSKYTNTGVVEKFQIFPFKQKMRFTFKSGGIIRVHSFIS